MNIKLNQNELDELKLQMMERVDGILKEISSGSSYYGQIKRKKSVTYLRFAHKKLKNPVLMEKKQISL